MKGKKQGNGRKRRKRGKRKRQVDRAMRAEGAGADLNTCTAAGLESRRFGGVTTRTLASLELRRRPSLSGKD
jgi:hypothetical protein